MVGRRQRQDGQVSRRQMLHAALATTVAGGLAGTSTGKAQAAQQASSRRGFALCIGLNEVNPDCYAGWRGTLAGCINDARDMEKIAKQGGFEQVKVLTNEEATLNNVRKHIAWAANDLRSGDIFLFSCSSHGSFTRDYDGDEPSGYDQVICLWDGRWIDDDRGQLWARFAPGVRIVMVADCCYSGSTAKAIEALRGMAGAMAIDAEVKGLKGEPLDAAVGLDKGAVNTQLDKYVAWLEKASSRNEQPRGVNDHFGEAFNRVDETTGKILPSPIRSVPEVLAMHLSTTNAPSSRGRSAGSRREITAEGLELGACQDYQTALDGAGNGLFTATLKAIWNQGAFQGDYRQLFSDLQRELNAYISHQPALYQFGQISTTSPLIKERPFQGKIG